MNNERIIRTRAPESYDYGTTHTVCTEQITGYSGAKVRRLAIREPNTSNERLDYLADYQIGRYHSGLYEAWDETKWREWAAYSTKDCANCGGCGLYLAEVEYGTEIQRCDTCKRYESDSVAALVAYRIASATLGGGKESTAEVDTTGVKGDASLSRVDRQEVVG